MRKYLALARALAGHFWSRSLWIKVFHDNAIFVMMMMMMKISVMTMEMVTMMMAIRKIMMMTLPRQREA